MKTRQQAAEEYAKSVSKNDTHRDYLNKAFIAGWEAAEQNRWISGEPSESGRYWCYVSTVDDLGVSHEQVNCSWSERHGFMENMKRMNVTHWMPLPSPPKPQEL